MTRRSPRLLLAWGNDARGDDGLALLLAQAVIDDGGPGGPGAADLEVLCAHQLQVEHVLDLDGREAVLLVDAALDVGTPRLTRVGPRTGADLFSHALAPSSLLQAHRLVLDRDPPPAWLLALPARDTALGRPPGPGTARTLAEALGLVRHWRTTPVAVLAAESRAPAG